MKSIFFTISLLCTALQLIILKPMAVVLITYGLIFPLRQHKPLNFKITFSKFLHFRQVLLIRILLLWCFLLSYFMFILLHHNKPYLYIHFKPSTRLEQYLSMYLKADVEFGYITLFSSNASMQLVVYLLTKREKHCLSFLESI